jgi:hypothetical protein
LSKNRYNPALRWIRPGVRAGPYLALSRPDFYILYRSKEIWKEQGDMDIKKEEVVLGGIILAIGAIVIALIIL